MKTFLNEAKAEYIFITDQTQKMENQIKTQDELIIENREHIQDLEEQLSQANAYSSEQNKLIERLEDELDQQTKKMIETEERLKSLSDQLFVLRNQDNNEKKVSNVCNLFRHDCYSGQPYIFATPKIATLQILKISYIKTVFHPK